MKKITLFLFILIVSFITMFYFHICPPVGPWPVPPWCSVSFTRNSFDVKEDTLPISQMKAVNMFDTWGGNYNFKMFENTRNGIAPSFERVSALGASEVFIHDFDMAVYKGEESPSSTLYEIQDETFWNDFRDEAISPDDLNNLVVEAHKRNLKLGIKRNLHFANMSKYLVAGMKGEIDESVKKDYEEFKNSHSKEWVEDFFVKWKERLVLKGELYEKAGVDIMSITPTFTDVSFPGNEELANMYWKDTIKSLRDVFHGKIHVELSMWDIVDWKNNYKNLSKMDFYKDADIVDIKFFYFPEEYRVADTSIVGINESMNKFINDIEKFAQKEQIKISITFSPFSYNNSLNNEIFEFNDVKNERVLAAQRDFEYQADAWRSFLSNISNRKYIDRVIVGGFWWDDAMDPEITPRVSVNGSPRNKIAEEVISQWFNKK